MMMASGYDSSLTLWAFKMALVELLQRKQHRLPLAQATFSYRMS